MVTRKTHQREGKRRCRRNHPRALAIRHMELPVGEFIKEGFGEEVPDNARELLESNVEDEERHDLALGYIADANNVNDKDENEEALLRDAWIAHPDHTITKALVAERAIFFVLLPFFRFNGDACFTHCICRYLQGRADPCRNE